MPALLGTPALKKKRLGPVPTPTRDEVLTRELLNLMDTGTGWSFDDSELEENFATEPGGPSSGDITTAESPTDAIGLPITIKGRDEFVTVTACPEIGSDESIVLLELAKRLGLPQVLQFVDGGEGLTSGSIDVRFVLGNLHCERGFVPRGSTLNLEFFILDNLTSDILVGQDTLEDLNAISQHGDLFIDSLPQPGLSDCNIIRHIGTLERTAKSALKTIKGIFTSGETSTSGILFQGEDVSVMSSASRDYLC